MNLTGQAWAAPLCHLTAGGQGVGIARTVFLNVCSVALKGGQWASTCIVIGVMHFPRITQLTTIALAALGFSSMGAWTNAQAAEDKPKADNTAVNKRDQTPGAATADQQKMNAADRNLTAKIRKAVMADKALSVYAHNVKIISQDGTVTLKGPVRSEDEVKSIVSKATAVTGGADKVINQLSVQPASKP